MSLLRNSFRGLGVVAGEHDDFKAELMQGRDGGGSGGFDGIGHGEQSRDGAVDADKENGLAFLAQISGFRGENFRARFHLRDPP